MTERPHISSYYPLPKQKDREDIIDTATEGQLEISLSNPAFKEPKIKVSTINGHRIFKKTRNSPDLGFYIGLLLVPWQTLQEQTVSPISINQRSESPINYSSIKNIGRLEYLYQYSRTEPHSLTNISYLTQNLGMAKLLPEASPIIKGIWLNREVFQGHKDVTCAKILFQSPETLQELGIQPVKEGPVFLTFTPNHILATTNNNIVVQEISPQQLSKIGIKGLLANIDTEEVTFSLGAEQLCFTLTLAKKLKPNYPQALLGPEEEWVTKSKANALSIPVCLLN